MPVDVTKHYRWKRVKSGAGCAKSSFRVKRTRGGLLRFCCPKGRWRHGRCSVSMKLQAKAKRR